MKDYLRTHYLNLVVGGLVAVSWSWILFVDVAVLSSSGFMGRFFTTLGFLCIWYISYYILTKVLRRLLSFQKVTGWHLAAFVLVWAFFEFLVGWLVTIIWIGRDGSIDSVLPFASFTPFLAYTPLGYLSRLVGYHGLSAIFVLCLVLAFRHDLKKYRIPVYSAVFLLTFFCWVIFREANGRELTATVVAENLADTQTIDKGQSQLIVLPEYGLDRYSTDTISVRFSGNNEIDFVGSQQRSDADQNVRNIFVHGTANGFLDEQNKSRLIPAGEYLPYTVEWFLQNWPGGNDILHTFQVRRAVVKGNDPLKPITLTNGILVGAAVCSSIISTKDYQQLARMGAEVFTNSASLGIFSGSRIFSIQHKGLSRFMAIANARAFLQSSSESSAFAIDHNGNMLDSIQPVSSTQVTVRTNKKMTPYTYLGEWMSWLGGGLLVILGLGWVYRERTDLQKMLRHHMRIRHRGVE